MDEIPSRQIVTLDIAAAVTINASDPNALVLVLQDWAVEVRIPIAPPRQGDEFPYLNVKALAQRIEQAAADVNLHTLGVSWRHGPLNGPVGWRP